MKNCCLKAAKGFFLFLALAGCLVLGGCGEGEASEQSDPHEEYAELIDLMEEGCYEEAIAYIRSTYLPDRTDQSTEQTAEADPPSEAPETIEVELTEDTLSKLFAASVEYHINSNEWGDPDLLVSALILTPRPEINVCSIDKAMIEILDYRSTEYAKITFIPDTGAYTLTDITEEEAVLHDPLARVQRDPRSDPQTVFFGGDYFYAPRELQGSFTCLIHGMATRTLERNEDGTVTGYVPKSMDYTVGRITGTVTYTEKQP